MWVKIIMREFPTPIVGIGIVAKPDDPLALGWFVLFRMALYRFHNSGDWRCWPHRLRRDISPVDGVEDVHEMNMRINERGRMIVPA